MSEAKQGAIGLVIPSGISAAMTILAGLATFACAGAMSAAVATEGKSKVALLKSWAISNGIAHVSTVAGTQQFLHLGRAVSYGPMTPRIASWTMMQIGKGVLSMQSSVAVVTAFVKGFKGSHTQAETRRESDESARAAESRRRSC